MRDLVFLAAIAGGLAMTLRWPYAGILLWTWFTCMQPHREAFDVPQLPLNLIIVAVTVLSWIFSRDRKLPPFEAIVFVTLIFLVWFTINTFLAEVPEASWHIWDETWKRIALGLFVATLATNKIRIHAIVWIVTLSLFYFGVKGGIFTISTGGVYHVIGPENSMIADNNQLAVALLMAMPLANYLRKTSANRWISIGLAIAMGLTAVAILGSYSRGAYLALAGIGAVAWLKAKRKIAYAASVGVVMVPAFLFMPQSFHDRMDSIQSADTDASFQGRVTAWNVAYDYARDHFPFGAGFDGPQQPMVFNRYFPEEDTHAAHSIFFEVLGDNGFVGLALYLTLLFLAFRRTVQIKRMARGHQELDWATDLANMIQLSLLAFCLGGSLLSLAYYDLLFIYLGLLVALRDVVHRSAMSRDPTAGQRSQTGSSIAQQQIGARVHAAPNGGAALLAAWR
jgi:putative inorganic carbon (hco3(-)) transporter